MKLYKALIGNQYVQGTQYVVHMNVQGMDSKTSESIKLIYEVKKTPSLSLLVSNGHFIKCIIEVRDGITTKQTSNGIEQCYKVLGVVELVKGNIQEMLLSSRDEQKANGIFTDSSTHTGIDGLLKTFGSFRFLNSAIVFNLPASMLQVL